MLYLREIKVPPKGGVIGVRAANGKIEFQATSDRTVRMDLYPYGGRIPATFIENPFLRFPFKEHKTIEFKVRNGYVAAILDSRKTIPLAVNRGSFYPWGQVKEWKIIPDSVRGASLFLGGRMLGGEGGYFSVLNSRSKYGYQYLARDCIFHMKFPREAKNIFPEWEEYQISGKRMFFRRGNSLAVTQVAPVSVERNREWRKFLSYEYTRTNRVPHYWAMRALKDVSGVIDIDLGPQRGVIGEASVLSYGPLSVRYSQISTTAIKNILRRGTDQEVEFAISEHENSPLRITSRERRVYVRG